jgi:DNA-binding transcriptional MerR regulator
MFSIGEFARHGRISVRMLRHYDAIGLLQPAFVDPSSGYRFYQAAQFADLNRIVALRELGFGLEQVGEMLGEQLTAAELRGMLKLRKAELQAQIQADSARLARVEARLITIEDEGRAPVEGIVVKPLAPVRVAELTGTAAGYQPEDISPLIGTLYHELGCLLASADVDVAGPPLAYYEDSGSRPGAIVVHAAFPVAADLGLADAFSVVDLPAVTGAATVIHRGSMDEVLPTVQALARWIDRNGYTSLGYAREITLEWSPDRHNWVTELQQPVRPADQPQA